MPNVTVLIDGAVAMPDAVKLISEMPGASALRTKVELVKTRLTKKFDGDNWKYLVTSVPVLLRQTFIAEACVALCVPEKAITDVEFRLGSLYVTFHVTHDEDISQEEMDRRIEEFPFREMWRLYNQRDGEPDGVDAALQRIKDLEEEVKEKVCEIDQLRDENAQQLEELQRNLGGKAEEREKDLLNELAKEQAARKKAESQLKGLDDQLKKMTENLKREKARAEKNAQRQNELIAAIIQENKKEKEAKEREFAEELEVKEYIIENLKAQLRARTDENGAPLSRNRDADQSEEFAKLMSRMEEMTGVLEQTQQSESEARAEIQRLTETLKNCEEARNAEAATYENNMLSMRQQVDAMRTTLRAEEHEKRAQQSRGAEKRGKRDVNSELKENETIVRQYETALENIVGTLKDRLRIVRDEYNSYLSQSTEEVKSEYTILEGHEEDSQHVRSAFRTSSLALQKIFWNTREEEVTGVIHDLDAAAATAEKSSAAVKVALAMLGSKIQSSSEQSQWMEAHQKAIDDMVTTLEQLNKRAFARQLTLMNGASN